MHVLGRDDTAAEAGEPWALGMRGMGRHFCDELVNQR